MITKVHYSTTVDVFKCKRTRRLVSAANAPHLRLVAAKSTPDPNPSPRVKAIRRRLQDAIGEFRGRTKTSNEDICKEAKISRSNFSAQLSDENEHPRPLSIDLIMSLVDTLKISTDWLFHARDPMFSALITIPRKRDKKDDQDSEAPPGSSLMHG